MKTKVAVIFGGRSTEHEISVISAVQTINAIDTEKYDVIPVYITKKGHWLTGEVLTDLKQYKNPDKLAEVTEEVFFKGIYGDNNLYVAKPKGLFKKQEIKDKIDVVFPVLHGSNGEDGVFQGLIETIGIPYVGCDVLSSAVGMDKIFMKMILKSCSIPVVDFVWFTDKGWFSDEDARAEEIEKELGYPVIVKPANLGSSVGIGCATNRDELRKKVADAIKYSSRIIVEKMIVNMKEINCSVLGDCNDCITSVLEEPLKTGDLLSYEDKYLGGTKGSEGMSASSKRIPAELDEKVTEKIKEYAAGTFRALSCNGVSRVDVMMDTDTGKIYVNEINTIPGSLSYYLWDATGINFTKLTDRLIDLALKRNREKDSKITSYDHNIFNMGSLAGAKGGVKGGKLK